MWCDRMSVILYPVRQMKFTQTWQITKKKHDVHFIHFGADSSRAFHFEEWKKKKTVSIMWYNGYYCFISVLVQRLYIRRQPHQQQHHRKDNGIWRSEERTWNYANIKKNIRLITINLLLIITNAGFFSSFLFGIKEKSDPKSSSIFSEILLHSILW